MNVPCKTPHSHRQVVKRHFSSLHPKTGGAILVQRRKEDADLSVIPSYPGHSSSTRNNAETRRNIGRGKSRRAQLPALSLYS